MANQWPDFSKLPKPKTVRRILIDEGNGLAERTDGDVTFLVESEPAATGGGGFMHRCFLNVPKVGYHYPFMRVVQNSLDYPVTVVADNFPLGTEASNEAELRKILGTVFRSDSVKNVVLQLRDLLS